MVSFEDDDDNASQDDISEENDVDEAMQDIDDADGEADDNGEADDDAEDVADADEGPEGDGDEDDEGDGEDDQEEPDSPSQNRLRARLASRPITSPRPLPNGVPADGQMAVPTLSITSPSPHPPSAHVVLPYRPPLRPEAVTAITYDIVPTIAAPHSTSINSVTATPDMRWVFTGGTDGYIRKFNWPDTVNGKLALTVAQKHPFVDSVTKAGVLLSYWENEETSLRSPNSGLHPDEGVVLSPVYSLAVHNQALWLLSGLESGGINLQTVRHGEGQKIHTLKKHTSAVSVLQLSPDERSVLSGSWDKTINDWDLNTGQVRRTYAVSGGQISAIGPRPQSSLPVPEESGEAIFTNGTFSSNNAEPPTLNGALLNTDDEKPSQAQMANGELGQETAGEAEDDMHSLFGDEDEPTVNGEPDTEAPSMPGLADDEDDEFSRAMANAMQEEDEATGDMDMADLGGPVQPPTSQDNSTHATTQQTMADATDPIAANGVALEPNVSNGIPHAAEAHRPAATKGVVSADTEHSSSHSPTVFLDASFDGTLRVWDSRMASPIARIPTPRNTPPWCMSACWSPDGNSIYAGRRNNTVDEYNLHAGLRGPSRTFRFPNGSGAVSSVKSMPNGRHLICASHDILRLYDLHHSDPSFSGPRQHSVVPFLIIPGHRTGVISQLYIDDTCSFLISTAGNRGWEGLSTEVLLGYEIGIPQQHQA